MVDFSLARVPDFTTAALSGYQAGRQIGRERRTEAALKTFQTDPDAGIAAAAFDPKLSGELRALNRERKSRELIPQIFPAQTSQANPAVTGSNQQPARPDGLAINMDAVRNLLQVDNEMGMQVYQFAQKATADQIKLAADHAKIKGQAAAYLESIPEGPEREAEFEAMKPDLIRQGFRPEDLAKARLDNRSLARDKAFGMTMEQIIDQKRIRYQSIGEGGLQATDYLGRPVEAPGAVTTSAAPQMTSQQAPVDPVEAERWVMSFPPEARPAIRAKIAEGGLGSVPAGNPVGQSAAPRDALIAEARRRGLIK